MIAAKRKTSEAPRREAGGRIKQVALEPYLAKETARQSERAEAATRRHEAVAKMLEARRRVEEVQPPRGRRRGCIRILEPFHAADATFGLGKSSPSPTGNRRTCYLLTGAGLSQNALQRTDRTDWTEARSGIRFIAGVTFGTFTARAFSFEIAVFVAWQEEGRRTLCRLTRREEREAAEAVARGDCEAVRRICRSAVRVQLALG
jgi:hypothetical protein